jgi:hypothetical protein
LIALPECTEEPFNDLAEHSGNLGQTFAERPAGLSCHFATGSTHLTKISDCTSSNGPTGFTAILAHVTELKATVLANVPNLKAAAFAPITNLIANTTNPVEDRGTWLTYPSTAVANATCCLAHSVSNRTESVPHQPPGSS